MTYMNNCKHCLLYKWRQISTLVKTQNSLWSKDGRLSIAVVYIIYAPRMTTAEVHFIDKNTTFLNLKFFLTPNY